MHRNATLNHSYRMGLKDFGRNNPCRGRDHHAWGGHAGYDLHSEHQLYRTVKPAKAALQTIQ